MIEPTVVTVDGEEHKYARVTVSDSGWLRCYDDKPGRAAPAVVLPPHRVKEVRRGA